LRILEQQTRIGTTNFKNKTKIFPRYFTMSVYQSTNNFKANHLYATFMGFNSYSLSIIDQTLFQWHCWIDRVYL
jgi:hypothetical protein